MTEINPPGWIQALATHTAEQMRSYIGGLLSVASASSSLKTANAVHPALGGQLAVTQNGTPNMSVNVASGLAFISGTEGTKQGTYIVENDGTVNKTITASDPTNPRIDLVVAKVQDAAYSGVTNSWSLAVVTGTPAATPSPPAAPANSITLAQIAVAANAASIVNANITDKRPYNSAMGGFVLCNSASRPSPAYEGLVAYELDTNRPIFYDGANWFQFGQMIVTSSTRPGSPYAGLRIYETDTKFTFIWNGSQWVREEQIIVCISDTSWVSNTTASAIPSGNTSPNGGLTFTIEANKRYWFEAEIQLTATTGVGLAVSINQPSGCATDHHGTGVNNSGGYYNGMFQNTTTTSAAVGTFAIGSVARVSGTITNGSTAGNFFFTFSQGSSSANASWVLKGTSLKHRQVP